jgi:hypothetical protein
MHLERDRRLPGQRAPPPPLKQALVQCLEHCHEGLCGRLIGSVWIDLEAYVAP